MRMLTDADVCWRMLVQVLDSFCYSGGFGISAALQGATSVDYVDSSAHAMLLDVC